MNRPKLSDAPHRAREVIERTGLILVGAGPAGALVDAGLWPVFVAPVGGYWVPHVAFCLWHPAHHPEQAAELREAVSDPDGPVAMRLRALWALAGHPGMMSRA